MKGINKNKIANKSIKPSAKPSVKPSNKSSIKPSVKPSSKSSQPSSVETTNKSKKFIFGLFGKNIKDTDERTEPTNIKPTNKTNQPPTDNYDNQDQSNPIESNENQISQKQTTTIKKPSDKDIYQNYTQKKLQQTIFMYMTPKYFNSAIQYYNENFDYITVLGTNSLDLLSVEFQSKPICNCLLLFITSPNEVKPIHKFLHDIGFQHLDKRLLIGYIVAKDGVNIDCIIDDPALQDYIFYNDSLSIETDYDFTQSLLDRCISGIIQNQPTYVNDSHTQTVKSFTPQKMVKREGSMMSNLYKVDIETLQDRVQKVKKSFYNNDERAKLIKALSEGSAEKVINEIPHLHLIKETADSLNRRIETLQKESGSKREMKELIENKFLLETYKNNELSKTVSEVENMIESKLDIYDKTLATINKDIFKEVADDTPEEMLEKRHQILSILNQKYAEYKTLTGILSNSHLLESKSYAKSVNEIATLVNEYKSLFPTETITVINKQLRKLSETSKEHVQLKEETLQRLASAISMSNQLLQHYQLTLSYDSIVLEKFMDIFKEQKQTIEESSKYMDTAFKSNSVCFLNLKGAGMEAVQNIILEGSDFVLYIGNKEQNISDQEIDIEEFLNTTWTPTEYQLVRVPELDDMSWEQPNSIERIISKLKYASRFYKNIYIIYPVDDEEINNNLVAALLNEVGSIAFGAQTNISDILNINVLYNNITINMSSENKPTPIIVFNKVMPNFTNSEEKKALHSKLQIKAKTINIPYKECIQSTPTDKVIQSLKILKQIIKRN